MEEGIGGGGGGGARRTSSMIRHLAAAHCAPRLREAIAAHSATERSPAPTPAQKCSVVPPIWHAATPVEAVAKVVAAGIRCRIWRSRKLLPVPAPPVKKSDLPLSAKLSTACCSSVSRARAIGESCCGGRGGEAGTRGRDFLTTSGETPLASAGERAESGRLTKASSSCRCRCTLGASMSALRAAPPVVRLAHHSPNASGSALLMRSAVLRLTSCSVALPSAAKRAITLTPPCTGNSRCCLPSPTISTRRSSSSRQ